MTGNALVFRLLLAVVLLAPLPLGSNRPLAWTSLAVAIGSLLMLWSLAVATGRSQAPFAVGRLAPGAVLFAAAMIWAVAQSSSLLPASLHHPLWQEAAAALPESGSDLFGGSLTPDPGRSITAIMLMLTYAGIFFLTVQLTRDRSRARTALVALAVGGIAYAAYGLAIRFTGAERILWMEKWTYLGVVTSTFVNRNSYGTYAGIGLICSVALYLNGAVARRQERRLSEWTESVFLRALPFLTGALVVGMALLLSHSRGALASTGLGLVVLIASLWVSGVLSGRGCAMALTSLALMAIMAFLIGGGGTFNRFAVEGITDETRLNILGRTFAAFMDAPWTGQGFGTFPQIFTIYRDTTVPVREIFVHAHNVHLETVMELGLVATGCLYAAIGYIVVVCARGLKLRRRDTLYPAVAVAVATLVGIHGLVDFSLQMPAIAATFAMILGLGFAQSFPSSKTVQDGS